MFMKIAGQEFDSPRLHMHGTENKETEECPICEGTGRTSDTGMSLAMGAIIGSGWWPMNKDCEECDGTGQIPKDKKVYW